MGYLCFTFDYCMLLILGFVKIYIMKRIWISKVRIYVGKEFDSHLQNKIYIAVRKLKICISKMYICRTSSLIPFSVHALNVLKLMIQSMSSQTLWGWVGGGVGVCVCGRPCRGWGVRGRWPPAGGDVGVAQHFIF